MEDHLQTTQYNAFIEALKDQRDRAADGIAEQAAVIAGLKEELKMLRAELDSVKNAGKHKQHQDELSGIGQEKTHIM